MTQNGLSPRPDEAFRADLIYAQARQNSRRFWVISGLWALTLIALVAVFGVALQRFNETTDKIDELEKRAQELLAQMKSVQELQQLHTNIYALRLQKQQSDSDLTPEEERFLGLVLRIVSRKSTTQGAPTIQIEEWLILASNASREGRTWMDRGEPEKAKEPLKRAIQYSQKVLTIKPKHTTALRYQAVAFVYLQQWENAINAYTDLIESYGNSDSTLRAVNIKVRGLAEMMAGQLDKALKSFDDSVTIASKLKDERSRAGAMENKGLVYLWRQDWRKALDNSNTVLRIVPDMSWNQLIRSIAADKLGDRELAEQAYADWSKHAIKSDRVWLGVYLPEELKSYVAQLPAR